MLSRRIKEAGIVHPEGHELGIAARAVQRTAELARNAADKALIAAAGLVFVVSVTGCNFNDYRLAAHSNVYFSAAAMQRLQQDSFYVSFGTSDPNLASYYTMAMVARNVSEREAAATARRVIETFKGHKFRIPQSVSGNMLSNQQASERVIDEAAGITGRIIPIEQAMRRIYPAPKSLEASTAALAKATDPAVAGAYYASMLTYGVVDSPSFVTTKMGEVANLARMTFLDVRGEPKKASFLEIIQINTLLAQRVAQDAAVLLSKGQGYLIELDYVGGTAKQMAANIAHSLNWNRELYGELIPIGVPVVVVVAGASIVLLVSEFVHVAQAPAPIPKGRHTRRYKAYLADRRRERSSMT